MPEQKQPNVGFELIRIHKVITRGLDVSIKTAQDYSSLKVLPAGFSPGFLDYVRCLATVLDGHHLMEDELAFPYFQNKPLEAPYQTLADQHHQITNHLKKVLDVVSKMETGKDNTSALQDLSEELSAIRSIWQPHIAQEEDSFSPAVLSQIMRLDEQIQMSQQFGKFAQEHSNPPELALPFVLFNLPPDERALMAQNIPPMVTQQLIPGPWKQRWGAMQPFLLE
jgi:hemerythrin-like domain-containing protein